MYMSILTQEECQALIDGEYDWKISNVVYDSHGSIREDTGVLRTFKEAPVSVRVKEYPMILREIITKYEVGDFCAIHRDNSWAGTREGWKAYAVWITPLNDDYEGGEIHYNTKFGTEIVEQIVGHPIKNDRRIRHEITEVTKGTRYSLVSWVFRKDE